MIKHGRIIIELQSALTAGSGYSYAGIIDSDICYDRYGLPYIPARRLKGCMREVAEDYLYSVLDNSVERLFGTGGQKGVVGITISNACIANRDEVGEQIDRINNSGSELKPYIKKQRLLEAFTEVKAQTRMEKGVAVDNSLRYTRVVKSIAPFSKAPLTFIADISYDDAPGVGSDIEKVVKGLRNIGLMRTRGLGSVKCTFEEVKENNNVTVEKEMLSGDMCEISYFLTNVEPLMISLSRDNVAVKYIPRQNVLGAMAGIYLSVDGNNADDEMFKDIFLKGKATFSNVFPCVSEHVYYPAPAFVNTLKKTKKLVNLEKSNEGRHYNSESEYCTLNGNLPKKIKDRFISEEDGKFDIHDVNMSIIYHHNQREKNPDNSIGKLYTQQVVGEGQHFCGRIILPVSYADSLISLLTMGDLYFGKSKTAQYGKCRLEKIKIRNYKPRKTILKAGDEILVSLVSDAIFRNENGYTVDYVEVLDSICNKMGIIRDNKYLKSFSIVQTKKIYGYQTTWNLRKPPLPAIEAGSVYAIKTANDVTVTEEFIGEKNLEGFGQIRIFNAEETPYELQKPANDNDEQFDTAICEELKILIRNAVLEDILSRAKTKAVNGQKFDDRLKMPVSSSLRGRITLMLAESIDRYPEQKQWNLRCRDFINRVNSIKSDEKDKVIKKLKEDGLFNNDFSGINIDAVCGNAKMNLLTGDLGYSRAEVEMYVGDMWSDILMTLLVNDKYMKGE